MWLKSLPTASLEKQACGAETTDAKVVEEVEKIIDQFPKTATSKKITMSVKPSFLYKVSSFQDQGFLSRFVGF